jgi:hypothetical protein
MLASFEVSLFNAFIVSTNFLNFAGPSSGFKKSNVSSTKESSVF